MARFDVGCYLLGVVVAAPMLAGCGSRGIAPYAGNATLDAGPSHWIPCTHRAYYIGGDQVNINVNARTQVAAKIAAFSDAELRMIAEGKPIPALPAGE